MKRPACVLEDATRVLADDDAVSDAIVRLADGYARETYAGCERMTIDIERVREIDDDTRSTIRVRMWTAA
jgi:hypothetical protein